MTTERRAATNRRLAKKRVQCLNEVLCFVSNSVLADRFFAKSQTVMRHYKKQTDNDEHTNFNSKHFDTFGFLHPYIYGGQRIETNKTKL